MKPDGWCVFGGAISPQKVDFAWAHPVTALPSKHSSGCHMATEEDDDQRTHCGKEIWEEDVDSRIQIECCQKMEVAAQNRAEDGEEWTKLN